MAKRYGRNQKRAHRQEIAALHHAIYGVWGVPPSHLPRIDHIPRASMDVHLSEDPNRIEEDVTIRYILKHGEDIDAVFDHHRNSQIVVLGDKCLFPTGATRPMMTEHFAPWIELDLNYRRVRAPKEL